MKQSIHIIITVLLATTPLLKQVHGMEQADPLDYTKQTFSLLHQECQKGDNLSLDSIKNIFKNDFIDINTVDDKGNTPLLFFLKNMNTLGINDSTLAIVKFFVHKGAKIFVHDNTEHRYSCICIINHHIAFCDILDRNCNQLLEGFELNSNLPNYSQQKTRWKTILNLLINCISEKFINENNIISSLSGLPVIEFKKKLANKFICVILCFKSIFPYKIKDAFPKPLILYIFNLSKATQECAELEKELTLSAEQSIKKIYNSNFTNNFRTLLNGKKEKKVTCEKNKCIIC